MGYQILVSRKTRVFGAFSFGLFSSGIIHTAILLSGKPIISFVVSSLVCILIYSFLLVTSLKSQFSWIAFITEISIYVSVVVGFEVFYTLQVRMTGSIGFDKYLIVTLYLLIKVFFFGMVFKALVHDRK